VHSGPDAAAVYVPARPTRGDVRAPDTTAGVAVAHDDRANVGDNVRLADAPRRFSKSTDARAL